MRTIDASRLGEAIESLCGDVSTILPEDVVGALEAFRGEEASRKGREVIDLILENASVAARLKVPLCQDTGIFSVVVTLGEGTCIEGDLRAAASAAVARATAAGGLRASVAGEPLGTRAGTGDNTPPLIDVVLSPGERSTLGVMAKGGGSEMASRTAMLAPGEGWEGVIKFALRAVAEAGARSCPPLVLGLGIGGSFDRAPALAKRALFEPLDRPNPDKRIAEAEAELVQAANRLGIGPGALGGTTTCIGARIAEAPCHIACLPVALCVNCHSLRRKVIEI